MICISFLFIFSCLLYPCKNEKPLSSCSEVKPLKTKDNTCASFSDVCVKQGDVDCDSFLNVCGQCPPANITMITMMDVLRVVTGNRNLTQKISDSKLLVQILLLVIIVLVALILFVVIMENRFKLFTKCCENCTNYGCGSTYRLVESRKHHGRLVENHQLEENLNSRFHFIEENNNRMIELLTEQFKNIIELSQLKMASGNWLLVECLFDKRNPVMIEFTINDQVSRIAEKLRQKENFNSDPLVFIFNETYLKNDKCLRDYRIGKRSELKYCHFTKLENAQVTIGSHIIKGNTSEIYEGRQSSTNHDSIIKRYKCTDTKYLTESKALEKELIAFQKFKGHPRFVQLLGLYSNDKYLYVEMEKISGRSINDNLKNIWPIPEDRIAKWCKQMLEALSYLHSNNIIHRNLKPSSIFIDDENNIKINGFDFSKYWMESGDDKFIGDIIEETLLSYRYTSPDFFIGNPAVFADDVWSVGAILVELVTGQPPYPNLVENAAAEEVFKLRKIKYETPRFGISTELSSFMDSCLHENVEKRATIQELLDNEFIRNNAP